MDEATREACQRAIHVIKPDGTVLRAGRATLYVLEQIGWGTFARFLGYPPMIWFVEIVYWLVARNRRFFSKFMFRDKSLRQ